MVRQHFPNVRRILSYVYRSIVRGNEAYVFGAAACGALNRLFVLAGMALTFKAVITAITPDKSVERVNRIIADFGWSADEQQLMLILAGTVFLAYFAGWLLQVSRDRLQCRLTWRVLKRQPTLERRPTLEYDLFIIEELGPQVANVTRVFEILFFSAFFFFIIAYFAAGLLVALVPVLALFVFFMLQHERTTVRRRHTQQERQSAYVNEIGDDGVARRRTFATDNAERDAYIAAREELKDVAAGTARNATLMSGVVMVLITLYVAYLDIDLGDFPFIPLFLVVSIRTLVAYAQQFGRSVSRILELRTKMHHMEDSPLVSESLP